MSVRSYRELDVWAKALDLAIECYKVSVRFPTEERFGVVSQLRRAAVSVAANIAEGHERRGTRESLAHLSRSRGSVAEVETYLELAERLGYASAADLTRAVGLADDVSRMLSRLRQSLNSRIPRPAPRAPRVTPRSPPSSDSSSPARQRGPRL